MKNTLKILKKSLVGVPVAIFLYELFNLTISIIMKQYVKVDGFNLQRLIYDYIEFGIAGYGYAFILNYIEYSVKNSEKNTIKRSESIVNVFGTVIILVILIGSIIEKEIISGLLVIAMISLLVMSLLFILFLFDKKEVNNINNRIKENEVNEDKKLNKETKLNKTRGAPLVF